MSKPRYRVWDLENKQMFEVRTYSPGGNYVEIFGMRLLPPNSRTAHKGQKSDKIYEPHFYLMQYIDVTDLQEKSICEGDIMRHLERQEWQGIVRYSKGGFFVIAHAEGIDRPEVWQGLFMEKHCEIIGNCFENPELLEQLTTAEKGKK